MLSNFRLLSLFNTEIQWHNSSRDIDAEKFAAIIFAGQISGIHREISMLGNLQALYLNDAQISGTIPREISMLSSLQKFYLYNTQISGTIPREISMLSNLQQLALDKTQISGTIPREFRC